MADSNMLAAFTPGAGQAPAPQHPQAPGGVRRVTENVALTDFNDQTVRQYAFELFQPKSGETYRIQVLRPDSIAKGRVHYHDKIKGGGVLCRSVYVTSPDGKQETVVEERGCCRRLGAPNLRFAALIIKYGTNKQGEITQPFSYDLLLWRFGADKFIQLRTVNKDWPLSRYDLSVLCTDDQYQKLQIGAKPDALLLHPQFPGPTKQQIEGWANGSVSKLPGELGGRAFESDQALDQFLQQAGVLVGAGVAPTMVGPADQPVANFADIIGQVVPPQQNQP